MVRETGCDARCGSVPHTHTVVTDTESWLTSEGREQSQGQEGVPTILSKERGNRFYQEESGPGRGDRHDTDLCTHITCTHVHTKAIRGSKPKSGETDLWFSLFLNRNTKLTSSKKNFPVASFLCLPLHWWLFFPNAYSSALPTASPPISSHTRIKRRCFRSHVPKGMVTQKPVKRRRHCRRQDENLWTETTIPWSQTESRKTEAPGPTQGGSGETRSGGGGWYSHDKPFFFSATVQPSYI